MGTTDQGEREAEAEGCDEPETDDSGTAIVRNKAINNFAPKMTLDLRHLPFPNAEAAKKYGATRLSDDSR